MKELRVAFDIGGVLSKYPKLITLYNILSEDQRVDVVIISDMHPVQKMLDMLHLNGFVVDEEQCFSADYQTHGEACKAVLCKELGVDILIDDFVGYVADGDHIRLLVMPNSKFPYYDDTWKTDGSEGDFGRRKSNV